MAAPQDRADRGVSDLRPPESTRSESRAQSVAESLASHSSHLALNTSRTLNEQDGASNKQPSKLRRWVAGIKWFIVDQYFLVAMSILILISSQVQVPERAQEIKETIVTYLAVAIIFFITGCTLSTRVLLDNYSRWQLHLFVQAQCFLMTSATTFGIVSACAVNRDFMDPWLLIGFIFMGAVPTTISSNVIMTAQANGNQPLTVVESTIGNFLGPFLTPLLVTMYTKTTGAWYTKVLPSDQGSYGEIYRRVFKQLGLSLFLPFFVGQVTQNLFPKATKKVFTDWKLSKFGSIALLAIVWQTYDQAFQTGAFTSVDGDNIIFIVFISIGIWALWLGISLLTSLWWLPKADTISVAYCVPAKTPAMGVPLSTVMYLGLAKVNESKLQIPMVVFQGFQIAAGSLLTMVFRRWIGKEAEKGIEQQDGEERSNE